MGSFVRFISWTGEAEKGFVALEVDCGGNGRVAKNKTPPVCPPAAFV
jgi:hypothetical protein